MLKIPLKYILDIPSLHQGDIILTTENTGQSKLVRKSTDGDYSHVMLHVGGGSCIHSDGDGVHSLNLQRLLLDDALFAVVLRPCGNELLPHSIAKACMFARAEVGKQYSVPEAARSKLHRDTSKPKLKNRQFCSRLVAQAYAYGDFLLVPNPDYCYPQDIAESRLLEPVVGCVRMASDAEIEFANSENPIDKQTQATNDILSFARLLFRADIQTFEDIEPVLKTQPHHDDELSTMVKQSGYLDLWRNEIEKNAWRYNEELFLKLPDSDSGKLAQADHELQSAAKQLAQFNAMRAAFAARHAETGFTYHALLLDLYQSLVLITQQRQSAAHLVIARLK